ncbi:MAG TPA: VOC family protein [Myxococcales bacterium]|nr:VOC family protein [Myxococcales bacterium]
MQKITPFLWFDTQAEEAMNFYLSVFPNSRTVSVSRYGDVGPKPKGTVMVATFILDGQQFQALNAGPEYKFNPSISFLVNCETQKEVDTLWDKLLAGGGKEMQCGWLTDKYGVSWQIVPVALGQMIADKDQAKANRVMAAMMQMVKLDIAKLKQAYEGR